MDWENFKLEKLINIVCKGVLTKLEYFNWYLILHWTIYMFNYIQYEIFTVLNNSEAFKKQTLLSRNPLNIKMYTLIILVQSNWMVNKSNE